MDYFAEINESNEVTSIRLYDLNKAPNNTIKCINKIPKPGDIWNGESFESPTQISKTQEDLQIEFKSEIDKRINNVELKSSIIYDLSKIITLLVKALYDVTPLTETEDIELDHINDKLKEINNIIEKAKIIESGNTIPQDIQNNKYWT